MMESLNRMQRSVEPGEGLILPQLGEHNSSQEINHRLLDESSPKSGDTRHLTARVNRTLEVENKTRNNDLVDYTVHPLVLGPAYLFEDFSSLSVNLLDKRSSGVAVVGINKGVHFAKRLRAAKLLTTFQVDAELGRASDSGWSDGKIVSKATWKQLASRPWLMEQVLATISAGHQKAAWGVAGFDTGTQEGYEAALKGPPRPAELSSALVYSVKLSSWQPPHFGLTVQCVAPILPKDGNQQVFLLDIVQEIGARLRTVALVHKLRCTSVGPWSTEKALLRKHWTLEHLLASIGESEVLVKSVWGGWRGVKREVGFVRQLQTVEEKQKIGGFTEELQQSLKT